MADPLTSTFGRRAFRGTGRTDDYFPPPPDLDFLQRPTFMAPGASYNSKLDPQSLISAGFSPRNAMVLQGLRQQLHEQSAMEREYADTEKAMQGLSTIDPSGKNFSKDLLAIFRNSPGAMRNPEVLKQADFISKFAGQPQWSVEDIEDPDIYQQAVKENWGTLSPQEAKRRANSALTQRSMRGELASLGMERADLDKLKSWTQEDFLREKGRLMRESKALSTKPWYERIGKTAAEDVRTAARETKALQDFEDEYAKVLVDNPTLTKDAYVKQFKGDPDFNSYKQRRLAESIPSLVQEYSLTPQEAAQVLGLGGMIPQQAAAPDPFADRTTMGAGAPGAAPAAPQRAAGASLPVPSPTVTPVTSTLAPQDQLTYQSPEGPRQVPLAPPGTGAQADLKREQPVTFESLARDVAERGRTSARRTTEDQTLKSAGEQKRFDTSIEGWEKAKADLLQGVATVPEFLDIDSGTPEHHIKFLLDKMGKDWKQTAFTDGQGSSHTWDEVARALIQDPRVMRLKDPTFSSGQYPVTTQQQQAYKDTLPKLSGNKGEFYTVYDKLPSGADYVNAAGEIRKKP